MLNSGYSASNTTANGAFTISTDVQTNFRQNDRIGKVGNRTGLTWGAITDPDWNGVIAGVPFIGLVDTNVLNGGGDSGGAVFWWAIPMAANAGRTAGIVTGGTQNPSNRMIFSRADRINSAFALNRY